MITIKITDTDNKSGDIKEIIDIQCEFDTWQTIYYVEKKRNRVCVIETEITAICFTNMLSYKLAYKGYYVPYDSEYLFGDFEKAMQKAEKIENRRKIKIIKY